MTITMYGIGETAPDSSALSFSPSFSRTSASAFGSRIAALYCSMFRTPGHSESSL